MTRFPLPSRLAGAAALLALAAASSGAQTAPPSASPAPVVQPASQTAVPPVSLPATSPPATGPVRALSLDDALAAAESQSETIRIARSGVRRSEGEVLQARSGYFPQVSGTASYTRTLKSQFSALASGAPAAPPDSRIPRPVTVAPDTVASCLNLIPASGTAEEIARGQSAAALCGAQYGLGGSGGGINFQKVGFGAPNQFNFGLSFSQSLFTGGRVGGQTQVATAGRRSAEVELTAQRAQLTLDVTQAYFDAALTDRLVTIAESSLVQTETVLRQTSLARQVGSQSEFELLRARVTRDNQVPVVLQRRADRDLARLRLKQLLNIPLADSLSLTTGLGDAADDQQGQQARGVALIPSVRASAAVAADTSTDRRAAVRQAAEALRVQEGLRRVARSERIPSLAVSSSYGRVAFPATGVPTSLADFASNWTVTVATSVPLFTGGRIRGDQLVAAANVDQAKARLQQTRELAQLDARNALLQLAQAEAAYSSSAGTAEQATRAYTIADLRYREGISTQLELSDSRLLLDQAAANRASAARNLQVARVRAALIRDLPLQTSNFGAATQAAQQQQQQQTQSTQQSQSESAQQSTSQTQQQSASASTTSGQFGGNP